MIAIETKYIGVSNYRPSRIKAYTCNGHKLTMSYQEAQGLDGNIHAGGLQVHAQAALALARKLGWKGSLVGGGSKDGYVFCFSGSETFKI